MVLFSAITLFGCTANYKDIKKMGVSDAEPIAEGIDINSKYTDSGRLLTNLITEKLMDYSNFSFPYKEFPNGIEVHYWDEDNKESIITADYAIQYDKTNIVDLRKNVHLITSDSLELRSDQLYWDQANEWVFTDQPYKIKFRDGSYNDGARFDSNQDFTVFLSRKNSGVQLIDKKETDGE